MKTLRRSPIVPRIGLRSVFPDWFTFPNWISIDRNHSDWFSRVWSLPDQIPIDRFPRLFLTFPQRARLSPTQYLNFSYCIDISNSKNEGKNPRLCPRRYGFSDPIPSRRVMRLPNIFEDVLIHSNSSSKKIHLFFSF